MTLLEATSQRTPVVGGARSGGGALGARGGGGEGLPSMSMTLGALAQGAGEHLLAQPAERERLSAGAGRARSLAQLPPESRVAELYLGAYQRLLGRGGRDGERRPRASACPRAKRAGAPGGGQASELWQRHITRLQRFSPKKAGYASFLHGKVVDMLYFPVINSHFPAWFPFWG